MAKINSNGTFRQRLYKKIIIKQEGLVLRKTEASQRISCVFRMYKIVKEKRRKNNEVKITSLNQINI